MCAICGRKPGQKRMPVDHDHETGEFRGILCSNCNTAIEKLQDDPSLMARAAEYVSSASRHPFVHGRRPTSRRRIEPDQVRAVRAMRAADPDRSIRSIARESGLGYTTVAAILDGQSWYAQVV